MSLVIRSRAAIGVPAHRHGKALLSALGPVVLAGLACFIFVGCDIGKKKREALAEGDRLYATDPSAAISKYAEGFDAAGNRKAEILARIVETNLKNGNTAEARKWVERG